MMDWSNERYVRVYTRDTVSWKLLDWRGRLVLMLMLRKVDRAGVLDVGSDGALGLAAILELPLDLTEAGLEQLTASRGGQATVIATGSAYVMPRFLEAQEAPQSDPQRKRESRSRKRDIAMAAGQAVPRASENVTSGHETDRDRHMRSQAVTPSLILPEPVPDLSPARAREVTRGPEGREPALDRRQALRAQLWRELAEARRRVAAKLNVAYMLLLAQDPGERSLAMLLVTAGDELEATVTVVRHVIAVAEAEAIRDGTMRWFTGVIFEDRNFRRLASTTLAEARAPRPTKRGEVTRAPARRGDPPPPITTVSEADRAAAAAELADANARLFGRPTDEPSKEPSR